MAINFPGSLDNFTNPTSASPINSPSHADQHANANDAIEALEAKVGIDGSSVVTSHDYKIAQLQSLVTSAVAGAKSIYQDVRNQSGSAFTKATPVYVSGSTGASGQLLVSAASNATEATSSKTMGITTSAISNNSNGQVISEGILEGIDTTGAADGDPVWLGVNGAKIYGLANKPSAPAHLVFLGIVIRGGQANTGSMYVKIQNGFELHELHNVEVSSLVNGNILAYDSTTQTWKNTNTIQSTSSTTPLVVKGTSSPSVNIFEVQNSGGYPMVFVDAYGALKAQASGMYVNSGYASGTGLVVRGYTSQTADLQQWQNSSGTALGWFNAYGSMQITNSFNGARAELGNTGVSQASTLVLKIQGVSGQTANLTEWQNSSGTALAKISNVGNLTIKPIPFAGGVSGGIYLGDTSNAWQDGAFEIKVNNAGTPRFGFRAPNAPTEALTIIGNSVGVQNSDPQAYLHVNSYNAGNKALIVQGAASQTANLQEWQNSSGTLMAAVKADGSFRAGGANGATKFLVDQFGTLSLGTDRSNTGTATYLFVQSQLTTDIGAVIKGAAGQTANLQEWQNSAGVVVANIGVSSASFMGTSASSIYNVGINSPVNSNIMLLVGSTGWTQFNSSIQTTGIYTRHVNVGTGDMVGIYSQPVTGNSHAGIWSIAAAIRSAGGASAVITNAYNFYAYSPTMSSGTITNLYGLFINTQKATNVTNAYGIYQAGVDDLNIINGRTTINSGSTTYVPLTIKGIASQTANLQEWQDSTGAVLAGINSSGSLNLAAGKQVIFGSYVGTKINLGYGAAYQIGIDDYTLALEVDNTSNIGKVAVRSSSATYGTSYVNPIELYANGQIKQNLTIASNVGLIIKGATSQTANLQEWQDSAGNLLSAIRSDGVLRVSQIISKENYSSYFSFSSGSPIQVNPLTSGTVGLVVKAATSQTANLQEWQDNAGTVKTSIRSSGGLSLNYANTIRLYNTANTDYASLWMDNGSGGINLYTKLNYPLLIGNMSVDTGAWLTVASSSASSVPLIIQHASSPSSSYFEIRNSAGNPIWGINSAGESLTRTTTKFGANIQNDSNNNNNALYVQGDGSGNGIPLYVKIMSGTKDIVKFDNGGVVKLSITSDGSLKGGNSNTISVNTASTVDTVALSSFTSMEYTLSIKQGSKIRSSKVLVHTDGTSVDSTEYGIMEMGGGITGILVTASVSGTDAILQVTITDAATTNATVKLIKTML